MLYPHFTETSISSSGMNDCDVVVLCSQKGFRDKIEKQLRERKYSVTTDIPARAKILNQMSSLKHGRKKLVKISFDNKSEKTAFWISQIYISFSSFIVKNLKR